MFEKKWISPIILVLVTWVILSWMGVGAPLTLITGLVLGVGLAAVMIAKSRGELPKKVVEEVVEETIKQATGAPDAGDILRTVETQLLRINEKLRMEAVVGDAVIAEAEQVIDNLLLVVPRALKEAPHAEATFDLEKMATTHLPELLEGYLKLSTEDQDDTRDDLITKLVKLKAVIMAAQDLLDEGNLDNFEVSMEFIKAKMV